jgi:hypothetical protein
VDDENKGFMDFFPHYVDFFQRGLTGFIALGGCNLHAISVSALKNFDKDQEESDEIFTFTRSYTVFATGWGRFHPISL